MDNIDKKLIELLQLDSRKSISDLSKELALSRPSVNERLNRLRERGVIQAFTIRISLPKVGRDILLIIQMGALKVSTTEFEEMIKKDHDIIECYRVTGESSYMMKAAVPDMNSMRILIDRLIPYGSVNTSTVLSSPVEYRIL